MPVVLESLLDVVLGAEEKTKSVSCSSRNPNPGCDAADIALMAEAPSLKQVSHSAMEAQNGEGTVEVQTAEQMKAMLDGALASASPQLVDMEPNRAQSNADMNWQRDTRTPTRSEVREGNGEKGKGTTVWTWVHTLAQCQMPAGPGQGTNWLETAQDAGRGREIWNSCQDGFDSVRWFEDEHEKPVG